ncbi:S-layer family protein [Flavobacterium sp. SLB02]|uniref:beta strand repeat-containing protein n=1 Tax=Flavobacterium sp. SLB02 TaxID=2665645 RepID=UPI0012A8DF14|nr:fibronectin type III domain-containing protein [Flavobacterium sp. SLB02]QGK73460.1 hypothetical protein GIY83_05100 [Flavobacterium sp. SLB02]
MKRKIIFTLSCRCILVIFLLLSVSTKLFSQSINNYTFVGTTAAGFTPITGGNTLTWTGSTDDAVSALIPIGFDFWYMGLRYTNIGATTNGWLTLGTVATDFVYNNNLAASGSPRPVIAPLWDDLDIVSTANVTYRTTGTVGSRIFTIQYLNTKWNYLAAGAVCSFQVNLYETTGKIEFVYRSDTSAVNASSASIGITATATGSGNYLSVNNAGTSVSSTTVASVTTKRVTGRTYGFTSPVPIAPGNLSFSAITLSSMTLNWNDLSANERGFVIYRSTDGINYSFVSQTAAGTTLSSQTGLTTGTTYYWRVNAITEGAMSSPISGTQATTCNGPIISQLPVTNLIAYYKFEGNAVDATGNNSGTFQGATPTPSADRFNNTGKAYNFNGTTNCISTSNLYVNPASVSVSSWFKTTTTIGGALVGFSSIQTGGGGTRDRFIYMTSTGVLYFGVAPGAAKKYINTTTSYNDGNWHMVTATLGGGGMKLYVDGVLSASDLTITTAETTTGYWRLGYSDISTWPNESSSHFFQGTLDDMLIYHRELSASEVSVLYNSPDGAGSNSPVCAGATLNLAASTTAGASYLWTGPNGFTSVLQNPSLTYSAANAGVYTVQVTLPGCAVTTTAYTNVVSTTASGQWTGNVSTDWANAANWCSGTLPTPTTDVVITAGATRMPNISTSVNSRSLTINNGASLTLTGTGTLNITGTLINNGIFTNTGTINFNGTTGQQTFSGLASFFNLTLSNSNGLLLPLGITINNDLIIASGTLNANNFNINIAGNWTNNTSVIAFTAGTGTVTFNSVTAKVIGGTFSTTFHNLAIANVGNTISLAINTNIIGNLSINTGTFDLGSFTANRTAVGGTLTVANNAKLKIGGTNTFPSNYTTNTLVTASTVEYSGTNQTVANQVYGNLQLSSSGGVAVKNFPATALTIIGNLTSAIGAGTSVTFTAGSAITINGNIVIGASTTFNGGNFIHNIGGNWTNTGTFNGNTSNIIFTGSGTTVSGSGTQNFNSLTVSASLVSFSAEGLSLSGNLATTGSGSFTQASGGTLTMTGTSTTISGVSISVDNLTISGSVTTTSSIALTGNLTVSGSFTTSAGTITMSGTSKAISGSGTKTFNVLSLTGTVTTGVNFSISSGLLVYGSLTASAGTVTFTGTSSLSGIANLFNVIINGTSLQLSANATLGIAGALTVTAGTLNVSSIPNTVNFNGNGAQSINAITYNNLVTSNAGNKTAAGAIIVNNDITIGLGTTFIAGTYTHSIYNNWHNNGSFNAGTSTVLFLGSQNSVISGATTFNIVTLNNTSSAITLTLLSNISVATINMTTGTILTEANTLTITTTRTGNGIILGTITRNHSFLSGTSYAFEGPNNLITFTLASAINSVTITAISAPVSDFPFNGSINRTYTVTIPSGTYDNATLRLHYEDNELNGSNESTMALWKYNGALWGYSGKTSNDTASNYIEQTLLLTITNRWTISDNSNAVQWNGSVSTDWNTAANWTVTQGAASAPPAATDIVNLGTSTFTNQPTISTAVTVKNINFGSLKAVNLSMTAGGSLVSSNMNGIWSTNAVHTINVNGQTISVNGDLALSDGTSGHAINLNIGSGIVNINGALTENGHANIVFTGTGSLNIGGDFDYVNGIFTPGSGTVTYSGSSNQNVGIVNYNNLTINKTAGNAIATSALTIGGDLSITAGEFDSNGTTVITGNVTIASGTIFQNNSTVNVGGNWNNNGSFTSNNSGTSVIFNGTGTQTISATTFNNLEFNKPVGTVATLIGDVTIKGNLNGTSGTLDIKSFFFNREVLGGTATLNDAGTLIIAADNAPNKFANYALSVNSTVVFNGTGTQNLLLPGVVYGNIIFRNAGTKILYTPITVKNDLAIESTAAFNGGANTITLNGNWLNNGTFVPATSTLLFTGSTKNITGNTTFNKVTVTGSYTILNNVTFNGLLNITSSGALNGGVNINTTLNADLINSGTLNTLGTTSFTGNVLQTLSLINAVSTVAVTVNFNGTVSPVLNSTSAPQFGYLNINNTGGVNASVGWTIAYALTVGSGASFNGGASTHNLLGTLTNNGSITSAGTLNFIPSSAVTLNMGTNFLSTGTVVFGGTGATTLAGNPTSLQNMLISNTNAAGITSVSNLTITNNFTINNGSLFNAGSYGYLLGGNLLNNGTLNSQTSIFTVNGSATQDLYSISPLYQLILNNSGGTVTISSNITVNNALSFTAGKIQTGNYIVIQPITGSVSGAAQNTGWIYGRLQKNTGTGVITKTFEIGNSTSYLPVSVAFANISTSGDLTVTTSEGDYPNISNSLINPDKSVNRYWTMNNSGIIFSSANVTFNYTAADVDAGAANNAFILGEYNSSSWNYPMVTTLTATSLTATGITYFADFQIGQLTISIKTWDGGAGTANWGDAANWNVDGVPTVNDNVQLTGPYIININVAATTKNLLLSDLGLVLSTVGGNTLTISGDLTLASGTFNIAGAFPSITGFVDVSAGTVRFNGSGSQTIPAYNYYNLQSSSSGVRVFASTGTIGITNTFIPGTNSYTVTGSTVSYNGTGAQTIAATPYHNLILDNAGIKTFAAGITSIAGSLTNASTITSDAISNAGTISYNGTTDQTITDMNYYNLDASNLSGIVTLEDVTVMGGFSVSLGDVHIGSTNQEHKINVYDDITIASGATLIVSSSSDAKHSVNIGGDIISNGVLDMATDSNSFATMNFIRNGNQTISGSGISSFYKIIVNQGYSNTNTLDVITPGFVVPDGFLTLSNGTFKLDNTSLSITPFVLDLSNSPYLIPSSAGLSVNAGTVNSTTMNWTVAGSVQVSGGTLNMGDTIDNIVIPMNQAQFSITGGTLNLASAISNPGTAWNFNMQGGIMNVNTYGSTVSSIAPFNMDVTTDNFSVSGGAIIIQNSGGTAEQNLGYQNLSTSGTGFTGGTLQMGNSVTVGTQIMIINTTNPLFNLQVSNAGVRVPLVNNDLTVMNNVTVTAGILDINEKLITIGGNISNGGSFIVDEGTVKMNGTNPQTIAASAFTGNVIRNLTIANPAGVGLGGALNLTEILLVNTGTLSSAGNLTLISTVDKTALIDGSGAGAVSGNVTMQRYLVAGFGYKYFSPPFQNATVNSFASTVDLNASFPNFYNYIENKVSSGFTSYTNPSDLLYPLQGYTADFGSSTVQKTVNMTGLVNNGSLSTTLYNNNQLYTKGFNLVGNPYPSPINWDSSTGWNKTNIDNAIYFFNSGSVSQYTGAYSTYINGVSSDGVASPIIASMQGFFVHVSDGIYPVTGTLGINNTTRINDLSPIFHKSTMRTAKPDSDRIMIRISANFSNHTQSADPLVVYSANGATSNFDKSYDAIKLMNIDDQLPNLYSIAEDKSKLVINGLSQMDATTVIPLGIKTEREGKISFNLRDLENLPINLNVYLRDTETGINKDLQKDPVYTVNLKKGTIENRFFLIFTPADGVIENNDNIFFAYGSGADMFIKIKLVKEQRGTLFIHNVLGQEISSTSISGNGEYKLNQLTSNLVYLVSFITSSSKYNVKIITTER